MRRISTLDLPPLLSQSRKPAECAAHRVEWMFDFIQQVIHLVRIRQNAAFMAFMERRIDESRQPYSGV